MTSKEIKISTTYFQRHRKSLVKFEIKAFCHACNIGQLVLQLVSLTYNCYLCAQRNESKFMEVLLRGKRRCD